MNTTAKVINVVSGKGGTGKSLLTAVVGRALAREQLRVLIVDMDVFVRGLTILLTESGKRFVRAQGLTVSDLLSPKAKAKQLGDEPLAIERFFECDVLPAVRDIGELFELPEIELASIAITQGMVNSVVARVREQYDIVFLDNRAGLDSVVLASCGAADIILSVAEDDEVSLQTNANLINHLRYRHDIRSVYTIVNKGRRISSYEEIKTSTFRKVEFNYVGVVPFDTEVMEDFGTQRFWVTVYETLYFRSLIDAWNNLASREGLKEISEKAYRFPPSIFMSPRAGRYSLMDRMLIGYGFLLVFSGLLTWVYPRWRFGELSTYDTFSIIALVLGLVSLLFGALGFRKLLVGPKFHREDHAAGPRGP